ncbi:MAG: hypothetical protein WD030_07120 [Pirellulales bacterium]
MLTTLMFLLLPIALSSPVDADDATTTLELPEKYVQFTIAGGGRYAAFQLASQNKMVVYDLTAAEQVFQIDEVAPGDLLAGSLDKLVVVSPSKMMISRWDLKSARREKVAIIKSSDTPREALLGAAGDGPLLLIGDKQAQWFDLEKLEPLEIQGPMFGGRGNYGLCVHVSAEGRTFAAIPTGYGPVGYSVVHLDGHRTTQVPLGSTSNAIRWAQPSADGHLLLLPGGEVFNRNGRPIAAKWFDGAAVIPSLDPSYLLAVRVDQRDTEGKPMAKFTVCSTADCQPLFTETGFEEIVPPRINSWHDIAGALRMGNQWRVQLVPKENLLVTMPSDNRTIVIRPFNLRKQLRRSIDDYVYVRSIPPLAVTKGEAFQYRVRVQSSTKSNRITLQDGPESAKLTDGTLEWNVPAEFAEPWARFLIAVSNADGKEVFHSFEVAVRDEEEKP